MGCVVFCSVRVGGFRVCCGMYDYWRLQFADCDGKIHFRARQPTFVSVKLCALDVGSTGRCRLQGAVRVPQISHLHRCTQFRCSGASLVDASETIAGRPFRIKFHGPWVVLP